ncbi:phytase [Galbibacter mesophilus]|uniref:phytase n=1 Tax=Galbibacter mesophilus TaxID=379069 RepID=UPI00191F3CF1|nr:phytase [Galbibacter mesophilus]MCM5661886.1 phytase [Galbibacter mesophilus]
MKFYKLLMVVAVFAACKKNNLPAIQPDIITENTLHDTDDPAIWVNKKDPSKSIVFGTDKDTDGAVYAFDLNGKIIESKTIRNVQRPNNVDIRYDFQLNDSTKTDILVFTERERQQIRIFSIPDMKPLDNGGCKVFTDAEELEHTLPMGISLYHSPISQKMYAIVGRKSGPLDKYLYQYLLEPDASGVQLKLVRKFGKFSGKKEIEAIAVDDASGMVYYSDEGHCIRQYQAEPSEGDREISCFGGEYFVDDIEGLAIANLEDKGSYLIASNQGNNSFVIFNRSDRSFYKELNLSTLETDGCEIVTVPLNDTFTNGLFVAMNNDRNFYLFDLTKLFGE